MVDYNEYTVVQLHVMLEQESKQLEKDIEQGLYIPIGRTVRMADVMETIGNKYVDYADDIRKGKAGKFE